MFKTNTNIAALSSEIRHINISLKEFTLIVAFCQESRTCRKRRNRKVIKFEWNNKWRDNNGIWTLFAFSYWISTFICSGVATKLSHWYFHLAEQVRYKRWLWWTRFGMAVGALQLVAAIYLMFVIVRDLSKERRSTSCFFGMFETLNLFPLLTIYFSFNCGCKLSPLTINSCLLIAYMPSEFIHTHQKRKKNLPEVPCWMFK